SLTCSSEANPVAKYTWSKVTTGHSPGHTVQGQQLSFHPIQSSDSGQYLCTAKNDLGTKSSPISIDVKCSVTLSCSSDANPAAKYTWFKDNQPLLWEPSSKDRGTYRCQAENQYGYLGSNSVFIDVLIHNIFSSIVNLLHLDSLNVIYMHIISLCSSHIIITIISDYNNCG
uniref:Ig-like domain-containing protein n=1 Tax=Gadus morhua TaxID=8049 RepID=A0A8C5BFZ3_GADMO